MQVCVCACVRAQHSSTYDFHLCGLAVENDTLSCILLYCRFKVRKENVFKNLICSMKMVLDNAKPNK